MFIYILALLRMLNLVFFILKVCLLAALYYQLQPPELIKLQHVYSTCTCVLMILDAPRSAYGLKFPRRQSHIHRWARLIKPRSKAEPCPYETQTGSRYPRHPPLGRPPRRRTLRPTPLGSKMDAFLLSINR